jgi:hypothetical protein
LRSGLLRDATELSFGVHESSARNAVRIGSSSISVLDTGLFAKISVRNVLTGLGGASDWGDRGGKTCYPNQGSFKNDRRRGDALRRTGIAATMPVNRSHGIDFATGKKCAGSFGARCSMGAFLYPRSVRIAGIDDVHGAPPAFCGVANEP